MNRIQYYAGSKNNCMERSIFFNFEIASEIFNLQTFVKVFVMTNKST